ncbi:MAG TPA: hypothetical protein VK897_00845 [Anaerolineales bacterium]|nr:hypothetical protein [Anaerolineales bacterium]
MHSVYVHHQQNENPQRDPLMEIEEDCAIWLSGMAQPKAGGDYEKEEQSGTNNSQLKDIHEISFSENS